MNNVTKRTLSGIGFLIVMLGCLLFNKFLFAALVIFMMVGMLAEFYKMTMGNHYIGSRILAILAGVFLFVLIFLVMAYHIPTKLVALAMLPIFVVMINSLYARDRDDFGLFSNIYTGFLYIAVPLSLSNCIAFDVFGNFDGMMLICFFVIIWCSDIGAFVFGCTLGKNGKKLFPSISPKKSWIGFWGGMFSAVLAAVILHYCGLLEFPLLHCIILSVVMDVAGVYGDLYESQWKRYYGLKDSGNMIPGHGGLMDRFDSTLLAIPVGVMYLILINLL
jgi:phosphatidate cytidylyltransferase